jgi:hypothetical protein
MLRDGHRHQFKCVALRRHVSLSAMIMYFMAMPAGVTLSEPPVGVC